MAITWRPEVLGSLTVGLATLQQEPALPERITPGTRQRTESSNGHGKSVNGSTLPARENGRRERGTHARRGQHKAESRIGGKRGSEVGRGRSQSTTDGSVWKPRTHNANSSRVRHSPPAARILARAVLEKRSAQTLSLGTSNTRTSSVTGPTTTAVLVSLPASRMKG